MTRVDSATSLSIGAVSATRTGPRRRRWPAVAGARAARPGLRRALLGADEWDERSRQALSWIDDTMPYLDVRAVCVQAVLERWRATGASDSADRALAWSREIARHASALGLLNLAGEQSTHLWGHLQEVALAETGELFGHSDLVECARASAPRHCWCRPSSLALTFQVSCPLT